MSAGLLEQLALAVGGEPTDGRFSGDACLSAARVLEIWLESMATSEHQEDRDLYQVFRAWVRERGVRRLLDEG